MNVPLLQFHLHMLQRKILAPHAAQEVEQTVATTSVGVNLVGWLVLKWFPGAIMSDPYLLSASIDRSMYIYLYICSISIYIYIYDSQITQLFCQTVANIRSVVLSPFLSHFTADSCQRPLKMVRIKASWSQNKKTKTGYINTVTKYKTITNCRNQKISTPSPSHKKKNRTARVSPNSDGQRPSLTRLLLEGLITAGIRGAHDPWERSIFSVGSLKKAANTYWTMVTYGH